MIENVKRCVISQHICDTVSEANAYFFFLSWQIYVYIFMYIAFEVFYMYLVHTPDGIVLVSRYYITCLNLLFSNRRVQIYI